jgi:hypothetical protein
VFPISSPNDNPPADLWPNDYDPLYSWIRECHDHGIQIFGWVNPYRTDWAIPDPHPPADNPSAVLPFFATPDGQHMYLDPSSQKVQDYLLTVIDDLVRRFDIPIMLTEQDGRKTPKKEIGADGKEHTVNEQDGLDGVIVDHYIPDPDDSQLNAVMLKQPKDQKLMTATGKKLPNARIWWLIRHHGQPYPYPHINDVNGHVTNLFEQIHTHCYGAQVKFGISPSKDQLPRAQTWMDKRLCNYMMPELYVEPGPEPNKFQRRLKDWQDLIQPVVPPETYPPLIIPMLITSALEKPFKFEEDKPARLIQLSQIKIEITHAQAKHVGQCHYSFRSLREYKHGGPHDNNNLSLTLKADHFSSRVLIPPANVLEEPNGIETKTPDSTIENASDPTLVTMIAPTGVEVRYWSADVQGADNDVTRQVQRHNKTKVRGNVGKVVTFVAIDAFDRKSKPKAVPIPRQQQH